MKSKKTTRLALSNQDKSNLYTMTVQIDTLRQRQMNFHLYEQKPWLVLLILLLLIPGCKQAAWKQSVGERLRKVQRVVEFMESSHAEEYRDASLDRVSLLLNRTSIALEFEDCTETIRLVSEIEDNLKVPRSVLDYCDSGIALRHKDKGTKSVMFFNMALLFDTPNITVRTELAKTHMAHLRYDEAIKILSKTLEISPRSAEAWYLLGVSWEMRESYGIADKMYRNALRIDPQHGNARKRLDFVYERIICGYLSKLTSAIQMIISPLQYLYNLSRDDASLIRWKNVPTFRQKTTELWIQVSKIEPSDTFKELHKTGVIPCFLNAMKSGICLQKFADDNSKKDSLRQAKEHLENCLRAMYTTNNHLAKLVSVRKDQQ